MNCESTYKIIELVGTTPTSWEDAVKKPLKQLQEVSGV